ncbi:hypothetical protein [Ferrimonas pelagia]|uniref:GAF domain-containing protein n=1 Tax=Ferrimonas pelagia TaxID=1177826 RepID=A0ABP9EVJ6_9GAMM
MTKKPAAKKTAPKKVESNQGKAKRYSLNQCYAEVLENHLKDGETIYYAKNCMLPILNIKILVKERSREELSDIDLMLFRLIDQGIRSPDSICLLTGLANKLVNRHLEDLLGRDLLCYESGQLSLSELGAESLESGVPVRLVQRAFRYCAVTEQLLPRAAYGLVYSELNELRSPESGRFMKYSHILEESQMVSLAGMDLSGIPSKRALNLTDEAIAFGEVQGYTSGYLQTKLFLVGRKQPERALVAFGKACLEYDANAIISMTQPLDEAKLNTILRDELSKDGVTEFSIRYDAFGLPLVTLEQAGDNWLKRKLEGAQPAILFCQTPQHQAKPVTLGRLNGHTVRFVLNDPIEQRMANQLSDLTRLGEAFYAIPFKQRTGKIVAAYIAEHANYSEEEIEQLREWTTRLNMGRQAAWLPEPKPEPKAEALA